MLIYTLRFAALRLGREAGHSRPGTDFGGMLSAEILDDSHVQLEETKGIEAFST
jgi:hypothetical protein